MRSTCVVRTILLTFVLVSTETSNVQAQQLRVELKPGMLTNEGAVGDPSGIIDEQREIIGPPQGKPAISSMRTPSGS